MLAEAIIEEDGEGFDLKRSSSIASEKNQRFTMSAKKSMALVQNLE